MEFSEFEIKSFFHEFFKHLYFLYSVQAEVVESAAVVMFKALIMLISFDNISIFCANRKTLANSLRQF